MARKAAQAAQATPATTFDVYSVGLCYLSVCTTLTDRGAIEARANSEQPTGTRGRWVIAKDPFRTGEPNPHRCERNPRAKHWLLVC